MGPASPWPCGAAARGAGREGSLLGFHVGGQGMRRQSRAGARLPPQPDSERPQGPLRV